MSFLNNIRLKTKLFAVVGFLIAVSLSISATVYVATRSIAESTQQIQASTDRMHHAGRATANLLAYVRYVEFLPLELTTEQRTDFEGKAEDELRRLRARLGQFKPAVEAGRLEIQRALDLVASYEKDVHRAVAHLAREKNYDGATKIAFNGDAAVTEIRKLMRGLEDRNIQLYSKEAQELKDDEASLMRNIIIITSIGSILGLLSAFTTIVMGVTKPLLKIVELMQALAGGNSDVEVKGTDRQDEIGNMARA
ncbi:MAG: HAMP domain-containing protein, partial [Rhabdaerophilum sp.]